MKLNKIITLTILITMAIATGNVLNAVKAEKEIPFGDLVITVTKQYELRYNDRESKAKRNGGFWHPIPPEGFYALGSIGLPDYSDPNGKIACICVKAAPGVKLNDVLQYPQKYKWIWDDRGTGAKMNGSCWRPIPPDGYAALGDVVVNWNDKNKQPQVNQIMCVKKSLTAPGVIGRLIWNDKGSGGKYAFAAYQICTNCNNPELESLGIPVNSLVGYDTRQTPPPGAPVINCLKIATCNPKSQ
jgi:hypothetical protein